MPRTKEQNEVLRAKRMEAILKGALKIYVEKGYKAAEIGDVAAQAGVARGLVYYYYKDKLSLFRELFRHMFELSNAHFRKHFSQEGPALALFERFVYHMYNNLFDDSEHFLFFFRIRHDLHELFSPEELDVMQWRDNNLQVMVEKLKIGMETSEIRRMSPEILASQFWGTTIHGLMLLRQRKDELLKQGKSAVEIRQLLETDIRDAALSCAAMLRPYLEV